MRGSHLFRPSLAAVCTALLVLGCAPGEPGTEREARRPAARRQAATSNAGAEEANKAIVRTFVETMNARELDALDTLVAADVVRHSQATPGLEINSLAEFRAFLKTDFAAVPDSRQEVHMMVADGDMVAVWATYSGTQQGQMGPFPPTGKTISADFAGFLRIEDAKIAEIWVIWDNVTILTQLGHMPGPSSDVATSEREPAPEG